MFEEESIWIKNKIGEIVRENPGKINSVLDIGSSTLKFRTLTQPCIDKNIFAPLREKGKKINYLDIKKDEGVDIVCSIDNIGKIGTEFDLVICANLLEHVLDVGKTVSNLKLLVRDGGYLLVTVPHRYFYHPDPIDTMYRPDNKSLEKIFGLKSVSSGIIRINKINIESRLRYFSRMMISLLSARGCKGYAPYLFKRFEVSCVLFVK